MSTLTIGDSMEMPETYQLFPDLFGDNLSNFLLDGLHELQIGLALNDLPWDFTPTMFDLCVSRFGVRAGATRFIEENLQPLLNLRVKLADAMKTYASDSAEYKMLQVKVAKIDSAIKPFTKAFQLTIIQPESQESES